ncbi:hypothetical protein QMP26_29230 [Enterocloster clostridioformis]|uniref:hypothetical protein n=1 Tax=Enterocloster clostridioformis TaxID=1531 RepID=UPI0026763D05|nr:hypothetical protein [Enterocloster clostridioformis]
MMQDKIYINGYAKELLCIDNETIIYECDRRACRRGCNPACGYTSDIRHAKTLR